MTICQTHTFFLLLILATFANTDLLNDDTDKKFNVVLILAKTDTRESYIHDSGIRLLQFVEKKRVKHCAQTNNDVDQAEAALESLSIDCKQLLKSGLYSLISYCRNVMGMTTAVASIENDTFSNGLRFKKSTSEDLEIRYHHPRTIRSRFGSILDRRNGRQRFITQPEHTEVFKIRSKREYHFTEDQNDIKPDENDPSWDIFGIMANVKLTFFGKLFENDKKGSEKAIPTPIRTNFINQIGKVSENALFELVKETLSSLQENENGFLMIIIGGCLREICDVYSSLLQSIKHVVENTDPKNTLIVLTGTCPVVDQENTGLDQFTVPVYVKGPPKTDGISFSEQLYDVPYAIKTLLTEINGGYFSSVKVKREKRNSEENRSGANGIYPSLVYFSFCFTLLLTV